ncbi:unnamed protein product [Fusarium langsethiae]|nr:unnamed protein product [Fusarium langsethiae]
MEAYKMMLQFPGVDELLQSPSKDETELALDELWNMLKKDHTDPLHLSDIIPHVLLELGEEQKCYDFIKWSSLHGPRSSSSNTKSPFFDLEGADACESLKKLGLSGLSLSQLVALTLLKLRLYMDLDAISDRDSTPRWDLTTMCLPWIVLWGRLSKDQYTRLCEIVSEANSHFWEALATERSVSDKDSGARGPGSKDEADLVLYYCQRAWDKSKDALVMIEADTSHFTRPAELRAVIAALRLSDWKKEGFTSVVVATDSTYVLSGATRWAKVWMSNGWKLRDGTHVKNKDLWELLLGEVERWDKEGVDVSLLNIPRHLNQEADKAAKAAATTKPGKTEFTDITLGSPIPCSTKPQLERYILSVCLAGVDYFEEFEQASPINLPTIKRLFNHQSALECLNGPSPPSMILISDGEITRHREVLERIIDRVRDGATVVLSGTFANMATTGEISRLFTIFGLPWDRGNYQGSNLKLSTGVIDQHLIKNLPRKLRIKTSFVKGVEPSASWYTDPEIDGQAAVAFTEFGSGRLGYIGYTDYEENAAVTRAMFGLD